MNVLCCVPPLHHITPSSRSEALSEALQLKSKCTLSLEGILVLTTLASLRARLFPLLQGGRASTASNLWHLE